MTDDEAYLLELYKKRVTDRKRSKTRRRRAVEDSPKKLSNILGTYFQKDRLALQRIEQARALMAWEKIVGEAAAAVSRPLRIRNGRLVVQVADPIWRQQLILIRHGLLKKFHRYFPKLRLTDIFFIHSE